MTDIKNDGTHHEQETILRNEGEQVELSQEELSKVSGGARHDDESPKET